MKRIVLLAGLMAFAAGVFAQYPNKPIRFVNPFPAGSSTDTIVRMITEPLARELGQAVVIDNKPGADAMIAGAEVFRAAPDGYTLLITTGSQAAVPYLRKNPPYDPIKDFTPIADIGRYTLFLFVSPQLPVKTLQELIAYAKTNPDQLNYGTSSVSNIVATTQMLSLADIKMTAVPYKSAPQVMLDLVAGRVQVFWDPPTTGLPFVKDGRVRVLATAHSVRSSLLPEVPTMSEAGMPKFRGPAWMGLAGPANMPREIVDRLNKDMVTVMKRPEVIAAAGKQAFVLNPSTPAEFGEFIKEQVEIHGRLLRAAGVPQQ